MTDLAVQLHEGNRRLDAIDRKILTVLQEDASLSVAEIGDRAAVIGEIQSGAPGVAIA